MKTLTLTIALVLMAAAGMAKSMTQAEIEHKAKFIIKAVNYVSWPEGAATNADGEIVIGVVGESQLIGKLSELAAAKTGEGTKMTVVTKTLDDDLSGCQMLFIPTEDKAELAKILKKLKNAPVLTISDTEYFARYGVMINFYQEEDDSTIKFEVNSMTLDMAGLEMSSKLLRLATVI